MRRKKKYIRGRSRKALKINPRIPNSLAKKYKCLLSPREKEKFLLDEIEQCYENIRHGLPEYKTGYRIRAGMLYRMLRILMELRRRDAFNNYINLKAKYFSKTTIWKYMKVAAFIDVDIYQAYRSIKLEPLYKLANARNNRTVEYYIKKKELPWDFDTTDRNEIKKINEDLNMLAAQYAMPKKKRNRMLGMATFIKRIDKIENTIDDIRNGIINIYPQDDIDMDVLVIKVRSVYRAIKNVKRQYEKYDKRPE